MRRLIIPTTPLHSSPAGLVSVIMRCWRVLCLLFTLVPCSFPARILGVFPIFSRSHFAVFEPLLVGLVERGHEIVVMSAYPLSEVANDYVHIDIQHAREKFNGTWSLDTFPEIPVDYHNVHSIIKGQIKDNENILGLQNVQDFFNSNVTFDLIIVEQFTSDVFLGFVSKFECPFITFSSCPPMPWAAGRYGVPHNPSYIPNLFSGFSNKMDFPQRIINVLEVLYSKLYHWYILNDISEKMAKTYFDNNTSNLEETVKKSSLFLVNSHFVYFSSTPLPTQVVEVGGIHVKSPKPLSQELDKWMNESTDGVIYFSFGSMLRGSTLPKDKVKAFLQVFESLPQRVLWKWEDDTTETLPENVKIMKWLPQRDVLGHPQVKVFISHGGLLGTTEAVVSGVPVLGIPMYGDQPNNVAALVGNGVAIHVDYNNITVESLTYALNTLIYDQRYRDNAQELSRRFLDRPMSPLDTAVYWTEYVIRHRGAPHLRSAAVHLPWYQYYLLDVLALLLSLLTLLLALVYYTVTSCLRRVLPKKSAKLKKN